MPFQRHAFFVRFVFRFNPPGALRMLLLPWTFGCLLKSTTPEFAELETILNIIAQKFFVAKDFRRKI